MIYKEPYKIRGHEIDQHYLFKPLFIFRYFFDCYANYCTDLGLAAFDLQKEKKTWVVTEIKADITGKMPRWREVIAAETWTYTIKGLRTEQNFRLTHNGALLAKGTSRWVVIDETSRKPVIHEKSREKMKCYDEAVYENFRFKNIQLPETFQYKQSNKVQKDEADFNLHLNSIRYIVKALDVLPEEFQNEHRLSSLHAKYRKEALAGDIVQSLAELKENTAYHILKNETGDELFRMLTEWKRAQ